MAWRTAPVRLQSVTTERTETRCGERQLSGRGSGANTRVEDCVNIQTDEKAWHRVKGALHTYFETSGRQHKKVLQLASAPIVYPVKIIVEGMTVHGEDKRSARGSRWLLRTQDCVRKPCTEVTQHTNPENAKLLKTVHYYCWREQLSLAVWFREPRRGQ
jgi:hypothetical protein